MPTFEFKIGDSVELPKGTPSKAFSGSLLDKDPFKKSDFQYDAVGKIIDINDGNIAVSIWNHGSSSGWIANISINDCHWIKKTDKILTFDNYIGDGVYQVFDPKNLPPWNSREFEVSAEYYEGETLWEGGWYVWATDKKHAIELAKKLCMEEYGNSGKKYRAKFRWRNQKPFTQEFYNIILSAKQWGEKQRYGT